MLLWSDLPTLLNENFSQSGYAASFERVYRTFKLALWLHYIVQNRMAAATALQTQAPTTINTAIGTLLV